VTELDNTKKFRKELVSGIAALVLLNLLAQDGGEMYGYQIAKELDLRAGPDPLFKQSALYPVLRQLHAGGLLSSRVEVSMTGPPRRYYAITPHGRETLAAWIDTWRSMRVFVDAALKPKS
jgi:PadR family transcriptional regulator PadR